jgi:hypothetical protein
MEKSYRNLWILFTGIFVIIIFGFFKTYFGKFPQFENTSIVVHFHAALFLLWFGLLFIQPYLINNKKFSLHRNIGKISYVLVPLMTLSTIAVSRGVYIREMAQYPQSKCIGDLMFPFAQIIVFDSLFILAIVNKRKKAYHMRYMIATSIILLGPALRRIFVHWMGIHSTQASTLSFIISVTLLLILLIYDYWKGKNYTPYIISSIFLTLFLISYTYLSQTSIWQMVCGKFVQLVF